MTQHWEPDTQYNHGDIVEYQGCQYKIIQPHRSQGDGTPDVMPALWGKISQQPQQGLATSREHWLDDANKRSEAFYRDGSSEPVTWVLPRGKKIPSGATVISREHTWYLYSCRTFHGGGVQLGKASESFHMGGVIGYAGSEIAVGTYEVLVGNMNALRWISARGRLNPVSFGYKLVEGGYESDGTRLYVAQVEYNGVFHPGKASEKIDGAFIPFGGGEKAFEEYRVLCYSA